MKKKKKSQKGLVAYKSEKGENFKSEGMNHCGKREYNVV